MGGTPGKPWGKDEQRESVMVFIGRRVPQRLFEEGLAYKWVDFPQPNYASTNADILKGSHGKSVGMSMFNGYSYNERCMLSLAVVNAALSPLIVVPVSAFAASHALGWRPDWWGGWTGLALDLLLLDLWPTPTTACCLLACLTSSDLMLAHAS